MQMKNIAIEFHTGFYLINVIEYFDLVTVIRGPEIGEFSLCCCFFGISSILEPFAATASLCSCDNPDW